MTHTTIASAFERLGSAGRKTLIPCIMAGDVSFQLTQDYGLV
ncbi:MAG: hypothetical protein SFH39_02640 [Candidatus Magnetobacterium sp. LHC-1]|nr:hypothetical protein [Candidatus Magnetobacterium casensis]